ncbi:MAG: hypothetical protein H8E27_01730 [Verrucomicrobia subdivision 3 bacterium]|nr:hypothetical protein [Limisphaerales bacterium]
MSDEILDIGKVLGVSSAGLATANFAGLDAFLNTGILAVTFLYATSKLIAWVIDRLREKKTKDQ